MYKERIAKLMNAVKNDPDDLEFVESRINTFTDYVGHVVWMEARGQRLRAEGYLPDDYQQQMMTLDRQRKSKHEVAMDAINQLNRLSLAMNLDPFYNGEVDNVHRRDVGDVIGDIVNEYFQGRDVGRLKRNELMDDFTQAVETIPTQEEVRAEI